MNLMPDPRFFASPGPVRLVELAGRCGAGLVRGDDGDRWIATVARASEAGPEALTYCATSADMKRLSRGAGACVTVLGLAARVPPPTAALTTDDPRRAFARMAAILFPPPSPAPGISDRAVVDPRAVLHADCRIDAGAVIGADAEIGERVWVGCNATVGPGVVLGAGTRVDANATIECAVVGSGVRIRAGARIGQAGFGVVLADAGAGHERVPQLGRVRIGDRADIGANTCIARGSLGDTVIGEGAMLDNLVQIAHNVEVGPHVVLAGQTGVAGSTSIGAGTIAGGQAGISDHVAVGRRCRIGAQSGVRGDLDDGASVAGTPAVPLGSHLRQVIALRHLAARGRQTAGEAEA